MEEKLDSNNLTSEIYNVCSDCGIEANRRTCLKRLEKEPDRQAFSVSTFHIGICDWCKKEKPITEVRDFFYPDFNLMKEDEQKIHKIKMITLEDLENSKNQKLLSDFMIYCLDHPEERFWQALRNWFGTGYILMGHEMNGQFTDLKDTFFFEGKDK